MVFQKGHLKNENKIMEHGNHKGMQMHSSDMNKMMTQHDGTKMAQVMKIHQSKTAISYSAKKAAAGKDIGKPGKMFSKIAQSVAKQYGSMERGRKVAGAVLARLRNKR